MCRILNVTGAGYADCNGLYTLSNLTSIWDSKAGPVNHSPAMYIKINAS
jgi:hypothetical protein